jgi:hypothetical protein
LRRASTAEDDASPVRRCGGEHAARILRALTRIEARNWADEHPATAAARLSDAPDTHAAALTRL